MKTLRVILAVSVVANAALLLAWMKLGSRAEEPAPEIAAADPAAKSPAQPTDLARAWTRIDSANLDELASRLKTSGFSAEEVRAIMNWKIQQRFPSPMAVNADTPYWRNASFDYSDPKVREERLVAMLEQHDLYRKYVDNGDLLATDPEALEYARQQYGPRLSIEKLQAIRAIESDYSLLGLKNELELMRRGGRMDAAAHEARQLLEKEKQADIAKLMTPEEFADYELRNSQTANSLRFRLEGFQPTEEEFKTIFALHKPFEEKLVDPKLTPSERQALMEQMSSQVAAVLGPERAADYAESQRGNDQTARLITRLGLPARTNAQVRTLRDDLTQKAEAIRANPQLSTADRATQLNGIAQEARTQLTTLLGARGFEAYNDLKGEWIRALHSEPGRP